MIIQLLLLILKSIKILVNMYLGRYPNIDREIIGNLLIILINFNNLYIQGWTMFIEHGYHER